MMGAIAAHSNPMTQISLIEAQQHLPELIANLKPGEEIQICQNERAIARLIVEPRTTRKPRQPGSAIGTFTIIADDEQHLEDFCDYMQ
jgi:antitoxin (DNA-binding transcriptional repressor) of toxin-antitoxin stability system